MGDDSSSNSSGSNKFINGLKSEWALFWHSIVEDEPEKLNQEEEDSLRVEEKIQTLNLSQIKEMTRVLSVDRKKLNQKLESLRKELDLNSAKLESLKLVGGDVEETEARIHQLSDLGSEINEKLSEINDRLKLARRREDQLKQISSEI